MRSTCAAKPSDVSLAPCRRQANCAKLSFGGRQATARRRTKSAQPILRQIVRLAAKRTISLTRHAVPNGYGLLPLTGMSPCCAMPRHAERARAQPEPTAGTARRARRPNGGQRQRPAEPDGGETGAHGGGPAESGNAARRARDGRRRRRSTCPRSVPDGFSLLQAPPEVFQG